MFLGMKNKKKTIKIKSKMGEYDCLFESNYPEKGYTVTVPTLPGIVTCGDTLEEAKKMAREAIELHCECLLQEGLAAVRPISRRKTGVAAHL